MNGNHGLKALALVAALVSAAPAAQAQSADDVGKWYLAPMLYGTYLGDSRRADDDWSYGLAVGKNINEAFSLELGYTHGKFDGKPAAAGNLKLDGASLDALFHFYRESRIHPYFTVGLGYVGESRASGNNSTTGVQAGIGALANLYTNPTRSGVLQLRGEVKGRWAVLNQGSGGTPADVLAGLGLQFNWGKAAAPIAAAAPVAAAPAPAEPPPPPDSDGDGVIDANDKCPNSPPGSKVDATGCEPDSDRDGVVDSKDQCPTTPAGTKVGAVGCSCDLTAQVKFKTASADLTTEGKATLDALAEEMKAQHFVSGVVEGHTDSVGKDDYNQKLSERRATTVREYLAAKGFGGTALSATGYGETKPVADNATAEGREQNRRVVVRRTDCN